MHAQSIFAGTVTASTTAAVEANAARKYRTYTNFKYGRALLHRNSQRPTATETAQKNTTTVTTTTTTNGTQTD